jgi:hypothetical protein
MRLAMRFNMDFATALVAGIIAKKLREHFRAVSRMTAGQNPKPICAVPAQRHGEAGLTILPLLTGKVEENAMLAGSRRPTWGDEMKHHRCPRRDVDWRNAEQTVRRKVSLQNASNRDRAKIIGCLR